MTEPSTPTSTSRSTPSTARCSFSRVAASERSREKARVNAGFATATCPSSASTRSSWSFNACQRVASRVRAEAISDSTRERSDNPINVTVSSVRVMTTAVRAAVRRAARLSVIRNGCSDE